ncbi:MAG TPA: Holliday junction branch migration protein RuvA [Egibacteraceae bacterium]|nr:Holliday junction branch migration protein RuvA [Egibacteraceae bacterium]
MIALLRGRLAAGGRGEIVVDVGGVGYRLRVPPGSALGRPGDEVTVHTHLAVREDALTLYGFADAAARDLFETLLSVTGVGPKLALAALASLGAEGLRRAVVTEDVATLTVVPGVGKRGAHRIILELRERLGALAADGLPGDGLAGDGDSHGEVRQALGALGYGADEVRRAMAALDGDAGAPAEDLLRQALRALTDR